MKDNNLKDQPVVLYDPQFFSLISPYQTALLHLRKTMNDICPATGGAHPFALVPTLDIGGAASKKANFACSVLAHYTLLRLSRIGGTLTLKPSTTDMVNILTKVPNEDKFGSSVTPRGVINGTNSQ